MTHGKAAKPPSGGGERVIPDNPFERFELVDTVQSISARFEQQVSRRPEKTALESEGRRFTYGQLDSEARRAALAIAEQCPPGERAALLLEHDACVVIGILAALKAGPERR